jgi:antitoxin VapB
MTTSSTARLFMHGRSQAVRLPKEFRMPGDRVRVRSLGTSVVLEPVIDDVPTWFAAMDAYAEIPFPDADEPKTPAADDLFDWGAPEGRR